MIAVLLMGGLAHFGHAEDVTPGTSRLQAVDSADSAGVRSHKPSFVAPRLPRSMQAIGPDSVTHQGNQATASPQRKVLVTVETSHGEMLWLLHRDQAPITVANFLDYAQRGHYNDTVLHRVIKGFMIQGGGRGLDMKTRPVRKPIKNESNNGLENLRYTIAMARAGEPDGATSQFFINTATHNETLDRSSSEDELGYAVFGEVVQGRTIVDLIELAETRTVLDPDFPAVAMSNVPLEPFVIRSIRVLGR